MRRAHWISAIVLMLPAVTLIPLLARGGKVAPDEETSTAGALSSAQADATPAKSGRPSPDTPKLPVQAKATDAAVAEGAKTPPPPLDPGLLQTIGTLSAAHYFQTYLNIGLIADGKSQGTYTDKEARKVLLQVLSLLSSVDRQLEVLGKRTLDKEDRDSLQQMRTISALLHQQGKELQTYWDSAREQDAARYETVRNNAYAAISKLMCIGP
jgi:hypothetical protein